MASQFANKMLGTNGGGFFNANLAHPFENRARSSYVWGEAHLGDVQYLRVTMRGLRAKLEADPARPALPSNEPGIGYRLEGG